MRGTCCTRYHVHDILFQYRKHYWVNPPLILNVETVSLCGFPYFIINLAYVDKEVYAHVHI